MTTYLSQVSLQEATRKSILEWKANLQFLLGHAKDRFPDLVWEITADDDREHNVPEEIWGHKAIVYARAPPSFQSRYLTAKPSSPSTLYPYLSSPPAGYSAESAPLTNENQRVASPVPSSIQPRSGGILRIKTSINSTLFSDELEYLYTGKGFEAFEFLYESFGSRLSEPQTEGDVKEGRIDKLRKDLIFMWRSHLYSDVRVLVTGKCSSFPYEDTTVVFSSHRFMLVSRCPYFFNALHSCSNDDDDQPFTLSLPSPPFTPASLYFTLGFIYTGTLVFSDRKYDLNTAFAILRSATYLSLDTLYDEIQARIIQQMMHGLFHASLSFPKYENLTGRKWGTGGCRCRQCARRAPRVLGFATEDDVKNLYLERGALRALVGLFGEGWCTPEFASLPQKLRESLLAEVNKRTIPENVFPLLFAAEHALVKLNPIMDPWGDIVREMIESGRRGVDDVLCNHPKACFSQPQWLEIMENDDGHFESGERVEWIMKSLLRGVDDKNAPLLYQTLASFVLLRSSLTDSSQVMLSQTSHIRVQVEQTQLDILTWIGRRWLNIHQEGGFDELERWAIAEIHDAIAVPVEDLLMPVSRAVLRARNITRDDDNVTGVNILRPSLRPSPNAPTRERASDVASSSTSVFRVRSNFSTAPYVRRTTTAGNVKDIPNTASRASFRRVSSRYSRPRSRKKKKLPPTSDSSRLNGSRIPSPTTLLTMVPENQEEAVDDDDAKCGRDEKLAETNPNTSSVSMQPTLINRFLITPSVTSPASRSMRRNGSTISRASTFRTDISSSSQSLRPRSSASSRRASGSGSPRSTDAHQGSPKSSLSARPRSSASASSTSTYWTAASAISTRSPCLSASPALSTKPADEEGDSSEINSKESSRVHVDRICRAPLSVYRVEPKGQNCNP